MANVNPTIPIVQLTGGKVHLARALNELLEMPGLQRFRVAVSYARWSGLGLLANSLEAFLKAGGEFQSIYGVANGITSPDILLYSLYLQKLHQTHSYAGMIEDIYQNAIYHPKIFEFTFPKKTVVVVGSNNLTRGGLVNNIEMALRAEFASSDTAVSSLDDAWEKFTSSALTVTFERIRLLKGQKKLGSELDIEPGDAASTSKPFINSAVKAARRPLFLKILNIKNTNKKNALIANLDVITEKPRKLYLQILKYETGGAGGNAGYQVQLPVATLSAFFGVAPNEKQDVTFRFGSDVVEVSLTHFRNRTHRVRLKPIQNIPRPAVVVFERKAEHKYDCAIVPKKQYSAVLSSKCNQQTRAGARRWGVA